MAITNIESRKDKETKLSENQAAKLQSESMAKLYKNKKQISNRKGIQR
jgi:hypothetical protein